MPSLKTVIIDAIGRSPGLLEKPDEQLFWLESLHQMDVIQMGKLLKILNDEESKIKQIHQSRLEKKVENNSKYLQKLKVFKQKELPKVLREMEGGNKEKEGDPANILEQLSNV
ncbi:MAG: hypothetical protein ACI9QC_000337 [Oceanicoccus sp.]|jgi:hypothetical protein